MAEQKLTIRYREDKSGQRGTTESVECDMHFIEEDDFLYIQEKDLSSPIAIGKGTTRTVRMINTVIIADIVIEYNDETEEEA